MKIHLVGSESGLGCHSSVWFLEELTMSTKQVFPECTGYQAASREATTTHSTTYLPDC